MRGVGVGGRAGRRPDHLLEHDVVAGGELRAIGHTLLVDPVEVGVGCPGRKATLVIAPRVDAQRVVLGAQRRVVRGLEGGHPGQRRRALQQRDGDRRRAEQRSGRGMVAGSGWLIRVNSAVPRASAVAADTSKKTGAQRVAPVVHPVIDQPRVPTRGDARAQRVEIRLVGDRVLVVGEPVTLVGEQLEQRDAEVGRVALDPVGVQLRNRSSSSVRKLA